MSPNVYTRSHGYQEEPGTAATEEAKAEAERLKNEVRLLLLLLMLLFGSSRDIVNSVTVFDSGNPILYFLVSPFPGFPFVHLVSPLYSSELPFFGSRE